MNSYCIIIDPIPVILDACQLPSAPENGMVECEFGDDGFATSGDECTFTCDDGFELNGRRSTRRCWVWRHRTGWTGFEAECKEGKDFCDIHYIRTSN